MTRRPAVWYGILGLMFFISLWRIATTPIAYPLGWWPTVFVPTALAIVGLALVIYSWKEETPGLLPKAGTLLGLSAALFFRLNYPAPSDWLPALGLVPGLAGIGMFIEINKGSGWRYSRAQAVSLIIYGVLLGLAIMFLVPLEHRTVQLNLFSGWSVFIATILEIWIFFGTFIERIVR